MEHIKLLSGKEYQIKDIQQSGNTASIIVSGISDYTTFRAGLTPEALETIEVYTDGGALCAVLEGYTEITGKFDIEEVDNGMDITVYLQKEDAVMKRMRQLEAKVAELEAAQS